MKNNIEAGDLLTLNDDIKYEVGNILEYENETYYLLVDTNNLTNSKILYFIDNDLVEVEDKVLLQKLVLYMTKDILKEIE